jgi:hypothetical protein
MAAAAATTATTHTVITNPPYECPTRITGPPMRSIARFTVATSSARKWRGSSTAITLCPASCRKGITLLHEDASPHKPWTKTMLIFVAFVIVLLIPVGSIEVLFCALAEQR